MPNQTEPDTQAASPGADPQDTSVSKFLSAAGFKRASTVRFTEGFKVRSEPRMRTAYVSWVESLEDTEKRLEAGGFDRVSELPESPWARRMAEAYADPLSARYTTTVSGRFVHLSPLPVAPRKAPGLPGVRRVRELLKTAGVEMHRNVTNSGQARVTGTAVVLQPDHVRLQVRPDSVRDEWSQEEWDEAVRRVRAALSAEGGVWSGYMSAYAYVIKLTALSTKR